MKIFRINYLSNEINGGMIFLTLFPAIYCNFKSETEKSIHTISGILENFKKPGLVNETLSNLLNLTRDT